LGGIVAADASGQKVSNDQAVTMVTDFVAASNGLDSQPFRLSTTPGASYSWFSVNELRMFDFATNQLLCVAQLPYNNPFAKPLPGQTSTTTTTSTSGSTTSTNSTGSSSSGTTKSGADGSVVAGSSSAAAAGLAAAAAVVGGLFAGL
jgi:hypothetical protein